MKAKLLTAGAAGAYCLSLVPETAEEKRTIEFFSKCLSRSYTITSRGFKYMQEDVEFFIQPAGRGD